MPEKETRFWRYKLVSEPENAKRGRLHGERPLAVARKVVTQLDRQRRRDGQSGGGKYNFMIYETTRGVPKKYDSEGRQIGLQYTGQRRKMTKAEQEKSSPVQYGGALSSSSSEGGITHKYKSDAKRVFKKSK